MPFTDDNKIISPSLNFADSRKEWTRDDLISELKPMCKYVAVHRHSNLCYRIRPVYSENDTDLSNEFELSGTETIDSLIQQLMARQRAKVKAIDETADSNSVSRVASIREKHHNGKNTFVIKPAADASAAKIETPAATPKTGGFVAAPSTTTATTRSGVQLLQLNHSKSTASSLTTNNTSPSLIFNLSHLQHGNSILILNSPLTSGNNIGPLSSESTRGKALVAGSSPVTSAPVAFLYSSSNVVSTTAGASAPRVTSSLVKTSKARTISPDIVETVQNKDSQKVENIESLNGNTQLVNSCVNQEWNSLPSGFGDSQVQESSAKRLSRPPIENSIWNPPFSQNCKRDTNDLGNIIRSDSYTATSFTSGPFSQENGSSATARLDSHDNDINSMDFIDNSLSTSTDDLFNLETFDMLTDEMTDNFSGLDDLHSVNPSTFRPDHVFSNHNDNDSNNNNHGSGNDRESQTDQDFTPANPHITDYSPEWSYPDGGMKVLVAGPWFSSNVQYNIIFDGISVPTSLVQNGVLRCFSPAHEPGFVSLQVAIGGIPISNSVIFEYRESTETPTQASENYFNVDGEYRSNFLIGSC